MTYLTCGTYKVKLGQHVRLGDFVNHHPAQILISHNHVIGRDMLLGIDGLVREFREMRSRRLRKFRRTDHVPQVFVGEEPFDGDSRAIDLDSQRLFRRGGMVDVSGVADTGRNEKLVRHFNRRRRGVRG